MFKFSKKKSEPEAAAVELPATVQAAVEAAVELPSVVVAPVEPEKPEFLSLTDVERLTIMRHAAELRACNQKLEFLQFKAQTLLDAIDPEGKYRSLCIDIATTTNALQQFANKNNAACDAAGERLGIDLKKHTFDPETGILRELK